MPVPLRVPVEVPEQRTPYRAPSLLRAYTIMFSVVLLTALVTALFLLVVLKRAQLLDSRAEYERRQSKVQQMLAENRQLRLDIERARSATRARVAARQRGMLPFMPVTNLSQTSARSLASRSSSGGRPAGSAVH